MDKIDFIVLWVDDSDPNWQREKSKHTNHQSKNTLNKKNRYRDWDIFHYWFRGVEKYAPWVNKIHLVTAGHLPKWLNTNHPKLNTVKHSDFIPSEYLPTFSSRPIELNLHLIPELSNKFVYFNDDMFIVNSLKKEYFFKNNIPTDIGIRNPVPANEYGTVLYNTLLAIERNFDFNKTIRKIPTNWYNIKYGRLLIRNLLLMAWNRHLGYYTYHRPTSYIKKDFEIVWEKENEVLHHTCLNKFRTTNDVNHQIFRWWRLASNEFSPFNYLKISKDIALESDINILKPLKNQRFPLICLNDNEKTDFNLLKPEVDKILNRIFPDKSKFEI